MNTPATAGALSRTARNAVLMLCTDPVGSPISRIATSTSAAAAPKARTPPITAA